MGRKVALSVFGRVICSALSTIEKQLDSGKLALLYEAPLPLELAEFIRWFKPSNSGLGESTTRSGKVGP